MSFVALVISGPSGSGKSTLCAELQIRRNFAFSVSATTRAMRRGEVHGRNYYFLSAEEFKRKVRAGEFVEYAVVGNHRYGTLRSEVQRMSKSGQHMLFDIDVEGHALLRESNDPILKNSLHSIFIMPPSMKILEERLRDRASKDGTDEAEIQRRLQIASSEINRASEFNDVMTNDSLVHSLNVLLRLVDDAHEKMKS